TGDYREAAFGIEAADGRNAVCDLRYVSHRIYNGKYNSRILPHTWGNGAETLEITLEDAQLGLTAVLSYTVFAGLDAVIRSARFELNADHPAKNLIVTRALSASIDMDDDRFEMLTLYGSWARERQAERLPLRHGKQRVDSLRGVSSHQYSPFFALVRPETTEDAGIHMMLARMHGDLPVAIGVIRNVHKTSYTQLYEEQMEEQMANGKYKCVDDLLNSGDTWEVE
ncbi:MAG: hypothetical protein J6S82_02270, partial [Bacteroidales bacterium]|nr:hypothetical protein [Bacteroidales bacterium]